MTSPLRRRFPRLYAAASLKHRDACDERVRQRAFSAAICRGLIEAWRCGLRRCTRTTGFPRLYAAASLKHWRSSALNAVPRPVFRGYMPRPH